MMLSGRKLLLFLIVLWLPLQGVLAAVVPLCMHENNASTLTDAPALSPQAACHEMDQTAASNLPCDNCAPCHAGCNAPIPSVASTIIPDSSSSYAVSHNSRIALFVPAQPQRPPLV